MYIARGGANTEPFLVQRVIGSEVEITPRASVELLRVVVVDPARGTSEETLHEQLKAGGSIRLPIPAPYGIVLLGAFVDGKAWEGWCAVLHPSDIQLQCEAPKEAKPGARIIVTLKTGIADRVVPVQLIVKDQRLIAPSDPQVELAACIKKNLNTWSEQSGTGGIDRQLAGLAGAPWGGRYPGGPVYATASMPMAMPAPPTPYGVVRQAAAPMQPMAAPAREAGRLLSARMRDGTPIAPTGALAQAEAPHGQPQTATAPAPKPILAKIRLQFPEIIYNNIVKVQGEAKVEITLGDSMTRYSMEAFALSPETLDWQRAETTLEAVQPVYGELTVSPFVFPGDPVMGRLDVGAASGAAIVEVRHDGEVLPLFLDDGNAVTPGLPVPSGSVVRFPVRPGAITAMVRDADNGDADLSERYVTEPGKLRHIMRRLRLLTPGDQVTAQEPHVLELKPMPGLERPFQFFVEGAAKYPYG